MKKHSISTLVFAIVLIILFPPSAYPCTTFVLHQGKKLILGRNLDWYSGTGLVIVNPRNIEKVAIVDAGENPVKWVSKFGSVTFNQIGRELPFGGINETGLVIEHMTLDETVYPQKDNRYAVGAFQWIQFQLDNYSTVKEVINSDTFLRISDTNNKIHFLVCDRLGNTAAIEFLNGKMVYHSGRDLPVPALANSNYEESLTCYRNNSNTMTNPSLEHFCTSARQINHCDSSSNYPITDYSFLTLKMVSQVLFTKWSIVYDISDMRIYFKIFETPLIVGEKKIFMKQPPYDPETRIVDIKGLDFNSFVTATVFDINSDHYKEVNKFFIPYTTEINKEFINKAFTFFKGWGLNIDLKNDELDSLAKYPESFKYIKNN